MDKKLHPIAGHVLLKVVTGATGRTLAGVNGYSRRNPVFIPEQRAELAGHTVIRFHSDEVHVPPFRLVRVTLHRDIRQAFRPTPGANVLENCHYFFYRAHFIVHRAHLHVASCN